MNKSKYIDYTLLKAFASEKDIKNLCDEAKEYNFKSVCVNPDFVSFAKNELKNSDVLVCTVIGFPLGANTTKVKVFEALDAIYNMPSLFFTNGQNDTNWQIIKEYIMEVGYFTQRLKLEEIDLKEVMRRANRAKVSQFV